MPSLRELLLRVGKNKDLNDLANLDLYILLKALVEAVEPGDTPPDEEYNDARDDRIRFLQKELAEAKAEIERLRGKCEAEELCKGYLGLCTEAEAVVKSIKADADLGFAKAKAKIEKWRKSAQVYRDRYILALNDRDVAQAELEIKNEDAEIGRLVRGMRRGSSLIYTGPFSAAKSDWVAHHLPDIYEWADDPAEALRAIQEVGDAEV